MRYSGIQLRITAVSYTHLDVYKRQLYILFKLDLNKLMNMDCDSNINSRENEEIAWNLLISAYSCVSFIHCMAINQETGAGDLSD